MTDPPPGGGAVPKQLEGLGGILLSDDYEPYDAVSESLKLVHRGCRAHVRTAIEEARKTQAIENAARHARAAEMIRELYLFERALWDRDQPIAPEHRVRVCAELSAPIIEQLHRWLEVLAPKVLPQSLLGKAVHYTLGEWPKLITFLGHDQVPLNNNRCENAIRPFVFGRKGWLFSDTVKGAIATANLFSIVENAKANGVEAHAHLSRCSHNCPMRTPSRTSRRSRPGTEGCARRRRLRSDRRALERGCLGAYQT